MLEDNQIYIVVDIETDGQIPGTYSMLSIGAVATTADEELGSFYRKLQPRDGAIRDPETVKWWKNNEPEGWKELQVDAQPPEKAMKDFYEWIKSFQKIPVFVAHPVFFDYSFIHWYFLTFLKRDPFHDYSGVQRTLDLASYVSGKFRLPLGRSGRQQMPDSLRSGMPEHTHLAIDDARGYGVILRNVLRQDVLG